MTIMDTGIAAEYATQPVFLRQQIEHLIGAATAPTIDGQVVGLVVPGANLLSAGRVAAQVYNAVAGNEYDAIILIEAGRGGRYQRLSICSINDYHTPLGRIPVSDAVRNELCDEDDDIFVDDTGHFQHEGVDVQLPFLQHILGQFSIVPIVMGSESRELYTELGSAIGEVMYGRRALVVACADFEAASENDMGRFVKALEAFDVHVLGGLVDSGLVRFSGQGALMAAVIAARSRQAVKGQVVAFERPTDEQPGFFGALLLA